MKKRFPILLLISLLLLFAVCACDSGSAGKNELGLHESKNGLYLVLPLGDGVCEVPVERKPISGLAEYAVMRGDICTNEEISAAQLIDHIFDDYDCDPKLTTDWVKFDEEVPTGTKEILVGATNRPETPASELRINDFRITATDDRIAVFGGSGAATMQAAELFKEYFVDAKTKSLLVPKGDGYRFEGSYICDVLTLDGIPLWEYGVSGVTKGLNSKDVEAAVAEITDYSLSLTGHASPKASKAEHLIEIKKGECDGLCSVNSKDGKIEIILNGDDVHLCARYFLSLLSDEGKIDTEKTGQATQISIGTKVLKEEELKNAEPVCVYVSPDGNDSAAGTLEAPLATLKAAQEKARYLLRTSVRPVTVCLRGGDYTMTEGLTFTASDSGTAYAPVTYKAYENETVNLIGGTKVPSSLIQKAANSAIVSRVIDDTARENLMQIDLSSIVDSIPGFYSFGHTTDGESSPITIYTGDKALARSRYPNNTVPEKAYLRTQAVIANADGTKKMYYGADAAKRIAEWSDDAAKDLYVFGFFAWDWTNEAYSIPQTGLDRQKNTFLLTGGLDNYYNSITSDTRFYFFNLPEEIDVPLESYIDREAKIAYFLPSDDFSADNVYISLLTDPMMTFTDTRYFVVEGINFLYTRGNAVTATGISDFAFKDCDVMHTSSNAASFTGTNVTVSGCHVYDTYAGGFYMGGGVKSTLTCANNIVENCEIHSVNRSEETYRPAVLANSLGMTVRNNKIYDGVHEMIHVSANDIVIEYNEIFNSVLDACDMGAIYFGRDPSLMGTVIRYNYFHDNGNPYGKVGQQSIFIDDGNNGAEIFGNIFVRGTYDSAAIKLHGAQFSNITNNIFVDCAAAFQNSDWGGQDTSKQLRWMRWLYDRDDSGHAIIAKIKSADFDSEVWHEHYDGTIWGQLYDYIDTAKIEEYAALSADDFEKLILEAAPEKSNVFSGNAIISCDAIATGGPAKFKTNYTSNDTDIFKSYDSDLSLTAEGLEAVRAKYPDFEEIPFDKIGLLNK